MQEIWKDIKDYEGYYQISNLGRVKSMNRIISQTHNGINYTRLMKGKILKYNKDKDGYLLVHLAKDGVRKCKKVHRLVGEAFLDNRNNKKYINHIDGNKHNDIITNLEWVTPSENCIHAYKMKFGLI